MSGRFAPALHGSGNTVPETNYGVSLAGVSAPVVTLPLGISAPVVVLLLAAGVVVSVDVSTVGGAGGAHPKVNVSNKAAAKVDNKRKADFTSQFLFVRIFMRT